MSHGQPEVSVIIVNRDTRQMLRDCLTSLFRALDTSRVGAEVIVVDNASTDGSPEMVREAFPSVHLIRNHANLGYGAANNQGIVQARGRHVFLLNSDTVVRPGALDAMVSRLEGDPRLGGVAPTLLNPDGSIQRSCWRFPLKALLGNLLGLYRLGLLDDYRSWDHRRDREVDWVSSAAIMIPRRTLDRVGLLDEEFFYGSDMEWAHRAARAGYRFLSLAGAEIIHHGRGSRPKQSPVAERFAGGPAVQARYFRKHYGPWGVLLFQCLLTAASLPRLALWEVACVVRRSRKAEERRDMYRRLIGATWTTPG